MSNLEKSVNVRAEVILVTPKNAKAWLERNTGNYRKIRRDHLRKMVSDMKAGRWGFTNASIAFDENDKLVDGQHRLQAVVESGIPQSFLVVWNMSEDAADDPRFDTGARRDVGTHLSNSGIKNASAVASCVRTLLSLAAGNSAITKVTSISDMQVCEVVDKNPEIVEAVHLGARRTGNSVCSPAVTGAWYWLAKADDETLAKECLDIFVGESEAFTSHPFARAREYFLRARNTANTRGMRTTGMNRGDAMKIFFSAWSKAKRGQDAKYIRMPQSLDLPDACHELLAKSFDIEPQNGKPV